MTDKKKQGKQNRDKGGRYERKVRDQFNHTNERFGAYRSAQRKGSRNSHDLSFKEDSPVHDRLHVECKYVKALNVRAAFEQAVEESSGDQETILVTGQPRQRDLAVVDLQWLLDLLEVYYLFEPDTR
jgi:hypothetical protein